jgi:hypothetical protein
MNRNDLDIDQARAEQEHVEAAAIERLAADNVIALSAYRKHRERDYGVGYGQSSGYAFDKRYSSDWGQLRFRCR